MNAAVVAAIEPVDTLNGVALVPLLEAAAAVLGIVE